ncbi:hypothetical protein ACM46_05815 [Chryseobacterium angstadtii]|uniref:Lipoprotein n=1 Tax=Chryseobacterium angstadtii TaxID=558151 RepID=A0A0J7IH36_9FLAO|nr:hypothetical protein [Chryseobacterium angstadtii]KMQ65412.1 hypothetical protein ACM46_05815 [Chryseobacterium angstadtii]
MKFPTIFAGVAILILSGCQKHQQKEKKVASNPLIEEFDFTKDVVFDTLNVPQHLRKTVKDISALNVYETAYGGKGSEGNPPNFKNFRKLYDAASEQELFALTDNKNSVVAVYAVIGLLERKGKYDVSGFQKMLHRKGKIHIQNGCIIGEDHPAEPVYWNYYYTLKPEKLKSDVNLKQLDSMLLFMPDASELILATALRNRTYSDGLKQQIVRLAFDNHRLPALLYLDSWHKKEYAGPLQKEFIKLIENDSIGESRKRDYVSMLLSFNNTGNKKIILNYLKKDSLWRNEPQIMSQLENNGISAEDYR